MQNNMERKEADADKILSKNMSDMGNDQQKEGRSSGESNKNDDKFMRMLEVTGSVYDEALRRLAGGEAIP